MDKIEPFDTKQVRTVWNEKEQKWYFVIADIVKALTVAPDAKEYTKKLRKYDKNLAKVWSKITIPLEVKTNGGRQWMNCANAHDMIRIILSFRSRKAKLFTKWIEGLEISTLKKQDKIALSNRNMSEFYSILCNPDKWMEKSKEYSLLNEELPSFKRMNELELIFLLLEENDIFYKKGLKN